MPTQSAQDRTGVHREKREAVDRVTRSSVLHGSEALCQLLRFLGERAIDSPQQPAKEYQIATEVFGRPADFDPRVDSTVRVQTSRLRTKLSEYYSSTGRNDVWQLEIPKGSYSLVFHQKPPDANAPAAAPPPKVPRAGWMVWLSACASVAALVMLSVVLVRTQAKAPAGTAEADVDHRIADFWHAAIPHPDPPLVIFSNAEFTGRPETGMRYARPGDAPEQVFDHYTGVGEVIAIHDLDQVFRGLHRHFLLKRGRLLNWDDIKGRDIVFLGSPAENLAVRDLPLNRDFAFQRAASGPRIGDLGIRNLKPQPGEQDIYFGSHGLPLTTDYALIELTGSVGESRSTLLLAGITTLGTESAVEFVTSADKIGELQAKLGEDAFGKDKHFSAVIRVTVQRGVPLDGQIVAVRKE